MLRTRDHERVTVLTVLACNHRLCPMLALRTNKDNDGDTPCIFSCMFSSPPTFRRESKKSSLMSQHGGLSSMWFMEHHRTAFRSKFSYSLCNAADIIHRSNGKPHNRAEPKSASVWGLQAAICLSGRNAGQKPFSALKYQPCSDCCSFPQGLCSRR